MQSSDRFSEEDGLFKETVEIAHSLDRVWTAISKMFASLELNIEQLMTQCITSKQRRKQVSVLKTTKKKRLGKAR
jgi:hypothetical protein